MLDEIGVITLFEELFDCKVKVQSGWINSYSTVIEKTTITLDFVGIKQKIIDHLENTAEAGKALRKPRKKKVKPASVLVSKMKYRPDWADLSINSIDPKGIIGASQLWVFNIKTRNLSVYHAVGHSGLSVRGTTIIGFDTDASITKKLRKPETVIKPLLEGGKIYLRKIMENIKTTEQKATGRINADTILLRVLK